MRDLLLPLAMALVAGVWSREEAVWAGCALAPLVVWAGRVGRSEWAAIATVALGVPVGWLWAGPAAPSLDGLAREGVPVRLVGRLPRAPRLASMVAPAGRPEARWLGTADLVCEGGPLPVGARVRVRFYCWPGELGPGDRIRVGGRLTRARPRRNPGGYDAAAALRRVAVAGVVRVRSPRQLERLTAGETGVLRGLWRLRRGLASSIASRYDGRARAVAGALLLGERGELDGDVQDALARTGLMHLVAVSGLHLGLLAGLLVVPLRLVVRDPVWRDRGLVCALGLYAGVTGFGAPAMRALGAAAYVVGVRARGQPVDPGAGLGASVLLGLAADPRGPYRPSFLLSHAAMLALLGLLGWLGTGRVRGVLGASLAAWLGTLAMSAAWWGQVAPLGVLLSPLALPPLAVTLGLGLADLVVGERVALAPVVAWLIEAQLAVPGWLSGVGALNALPAQAPPLWLGALASGLLALRLLGGSPPWTPGGRVVAVALACATTGATVAGPGWTHGRGLALWQLDVGHGLAALVRLPDGSILLYDAGSLGVEGPGRRTLLPALRTLGVRRIDHLVLSHGDGDHVNGVDDLRRAMPIGAVWVGSRTLRDRRGRVARLLTDGARLRWLAEGDHDYRLGGALVRFHVPDQRADDRNATSVVVEVAAGWRLALTGDLEGPALRRWLEGRPPCDVALAPHHGNPAGGPEALLDRLRPRLVVASTRLVRPALRAACAARGVALHETVDGALHVWLEGDHLRARSVLGEGRSVRVVDRTPERSGPR